MRFFKSQITKLKSQINSKLQNSNPKWFDRLTTLSQVEGQISEYNKSYQFNLSSKLATFHLIAVQKLSAGESLFGSLELGTWELFVICYLELGIFSFRGLQITNMTYLSHSQDHDLVTTVGCSIPATRFISTGKRI